MIRQSLARTRDPGTTGKRPVDVRFAADTGVTSEALYAQFLALRYKEPGTSLGQRNERLSMARMGKRLTA